MALSYVSYRSGIGHCYNNRRRRKAGPSEPGDKRGRGATALPDVGRYVYPIRGADHTQLIPTTLRLPPALPRIFRPSYGPAEVVNAIESEMQSIVEQRAERHPLTAIKYRAIRNGEQGGNRPPPYFRKNNICMTIYYCLPLNPVPSPYISRPSNGPEVVQVWGTFLNSMLSKAGAKLAEYTASFS